MRAWIEELPLKTIPSIWGVDENLKFMKQNQNYPIKTIVVLPKKNLFSWICVTIMFAVFFLATNLLISLEKSNKIFLETKHTHTKLKHSFLTNKQSLCISYLANSNGRTIIKINDYLRGSYDRFGNNNVQNFKFQQLQMKVAITRAMIKASLESSRVRPISLNHKY